MSNRVSVSPSYTTSSKLVMIRSVTAVCLSSAELPENWTDTRETLLEGMVFQLKYLGVTMVEQPKGEELSAAAVKRIVATVREKTHTLMLLQQAKTHTHISPGVA